MSLRCWFLLVFVGTGCPDSHRSSTANRGPQPSGETLSINQDASVRNTDQRDGGSQMTQGDASYRRWIWGVTVDDVTSLDSTLDALMTFAARPTTRVVFDEKQSAS